MSKKVTTTIYITEEQSIKLKELNEKTKVPVSEYIREGIDLILDKHKKLLSGQMTFDDLIKQETRNSKKGN